MRTDNDQHQAVLPFSQIKLDPARALKESKRFLGCVQTAL